MRLRITILAVFVASSLIAFARKEETVAELTVRAESAKLDDRPRLYAEIGRRQVKAADELYAAGKPEEARAAVRDVVQYSDKARDAALAFDALLLDFDARRPRPTFTPGCHCRSRFQSSSPRSFLRRRLRP